MEYGGGGEMIYRCVLCNKLCTDDDLRRMNNRCPTDGCEGTVDHMIQGDSVDHPGHYNWIPGIECIDVVEHFNFNLGNAIKYIWRAGRKRERSWKEDLEKAAWYIQREIELKEEE